MISTCRQFLAGEFRAHTVHEWFAFPPRRAGIRARRRSVTALGVGANVARFGIVRAVALDLFSELWRHQTGGGRIGANNEGVVFHP